MQITGSLPSAPNPTDTSNIDDEPTATSSIDDELNQFTDISIAQPIEVPILWFILNGILAIICSMVVARIYVKYGESISNRRMFARIFPMIGVTVFLVITIVKSSLALSLGLVGALSIVRFRTAIKEPEELAYIFLVIAIGLGFGANQTLITAMGVVIVVVYVISRRLYFPQKHELNHFLVITLKKDIDIDLVTQIITDNATTVNLKRLEKAEATNEFTYHVDLTDMDQITKIEKSLIAADPDVTFTVLDNKGLFS